MKKYKVIISDLEQEEANDVEWFLKKSVEYNRLGIDIRDCIQVVGE